MSDPVFSANDLIRYYGGLANSSGGMTNTQQFAGPFRIPGMNHCMEGSALDIFDDLTAIEDPVCPYPQISEYKGKGSTDEAANFAGEDVKEPGSGK